MSIGMLWFDNDPKASLELKVQRAVDYYKGKYGKDPDTCYVSARAGIQGDLIVGTTTVKTSRYILANHFWIGIDKAIMEVEHAN